MVETNATRIEDLARQHGDYCVIGFDQIRDLIEHYGSTREVEKAALEIGVVPARYLRNVGTFGIDGQLNLLRSSVAVVGLGGLGGYVCEALARMGVGRLVLIDGDRFEDHNLNRQVLSSERDLGRKKAEAACSRVARVNGSVRTVGHSEHLNRGNLSRLLQGADVVVDALDSLPDRVMLQDGAQALGLPMVHGSIGGFLGQVMTIFPGDDGLHRLFGDGDDLPEHGLESELGTPAATPMAVAAWEAQEVVKILTGRGAPLRHQLLVIDMGAPACQIVELG